MDLWLERLTHACTQAGDRPIRWHEPAADASLLLLPGVGRIMACQMQGVEGNVFYHHPALEDASRAGEMLAAGGGVGGDRLWIAPESAFMWRDLAAMRHDLPAHAKTPPAMDPAAWQIVRQTPRFLLLQAVMALQDHRHGQPLSLRVQRQFEWLQGLEGLPAGLSALSFAIENEVTFIQGGQDTQAGAWDLLQLPPGGTFICPTLAQPDMAHVRSYYESMEHHVRPDGDAVLFHIDSRRRVKMGLGPAMTAGRMAYYRRSGRDDVSTLIFRSFLPCPGMTYIDLPVDDILQGRREGGDALQAYNHNTWETSPETAFGEMEYHEPAVQPGDAPMTRRGRSITHILAGPDALVKAAGATLLGSDIRTF